MNHLEFAPYHNRHIVFRLKNGNEKSGVVLDTMSFDENNQYKTKYKFITTVNLVSWTKAKKEGNLDKMARLESEIDISDIVWAERLNY